MGPELSFALYHVDAHGRDESCPVRYHCAKAAHGRCYTNAPGCLVRLSTRASWRILPGTVPRSRRGITAALLRLSWAAAPFQARSKIRLDKRVQSRMHSRVRTASSVYVPIAQWYGTGPVSSWVACFPGGRSSSVMATAKLFLRRQSTAATLTG